MTAKAKMTFWVFFANNENVYAVRHFKTFGGAYRYVKSRHWMAKYSYYNPKPHWAIERKRWYTDEDGKLQLDRRSAIIAQSRDYPHAANFKRSWLEEKQL